MSEYKGGCEMPCLRIPTATYRLQFQRKFGFADARTLVPYLHSLGVTDIYASPVYKARQESTHGYDVTDPTRLNPELGGAEAFDALVKTLENYKMELLLDIVPNHMAASSENPWWQDVLQNGPDSSFSSFFDINWQPVTPGLKNKVLLPILNSSYGKVLEEQDLTLTISKDSFHINYQNSRLPLNAWAYGQILSYRNEELTEILGPNHPAVLHLKDLMRALEKIPPATQKNESKALFQKAKKKLWQIYNNYPEIKTFIKENLSIFNGIKGNPSSFNRLDQLLTGQFYRLAFWRAANQEINYRRFFSISDLVSVRVEDEQVFKATHSLILQLAKAGKISGLRIDHIDGLFDPQTYLRKLQKKLPNFYVVVEKILGGDEELPVEWPVHGTTGYDFLKLVNELFVCSPGIETLDKIYSRLQGAETDFAKLVYSRKRRVMSELFSSEVQTLAQQLGQLAKHDRYGHDYTLPQLERALIEVTAFLPVYRTYISDFTVAKRDRAYIEDAVALAAQQNPDLGSACNFLRSVLLLEFPEYLPAETKQERLYFVMRWQQFTGPIMAKGFEDTALYVYNRLISLNEVGGEPNSKGITVAEFHRFNQDRQKRWAHTINATSTHDTKRSEDVRARINVLSEIPTVWSKHLKQWFRWNRQAKLIINGKLVPDENMELFIYQTLIGAWPLQNEEVPAFKRRLENYLIKSAREADIYTNWLQPDDNYEKALINFVMSILNSTAENPFLKDFLKFQRAIAYYGALNSLSQVLLKITSPGVPDFYQGTELWNFSLVDPDNRHLVDFRKRAVLLDTIQKQENRGTLELARKLLASWEDGRVKLFLTYKSLHFRRANRQLFASGEYIPLQTTNSQYEHVCAFTRNMEGIWVLVAVPRLLAYLRAKSLQPQKSSTPGKSLQDKFFMENTANLLLEKNTIWGKNALVIPKHAPDTWRNILTGEELNAALGTEITDSNTSGCKVLPLKCIFKNFPVALLAGQKSVLNLLNAGA